jgi:hypothetical protein
VIPVLEPTPTQSQDVVEWLDVPPDATFPGGPPLGNSIYRAVLIGGTSPTVVFGNPNLQSLEFTAQAIDIFTDRRSWQPNPATAIPAALDSVEDVTAVQTPPGTSATIVVGVVPPASSRFEVTIVAQDDTLGVSPATSYKRTAIVRSSGTVVDGQGPPPPGAISLSEKLNVDQPLWTVGDITLVGVFLHLTVTNSGPTTVTWGVWTKTYQVTAA